MNLVSGIRLSIPSLSRERRKRTICVSLSGGALFALLYAFGYETEHFHTCAMPGTLLQAACLFPFFSIELFILFALYESLRLPYSGGHFSAPISFAVILACYLLMDAVMYPGTFCIDTGNQIGQIVMSRYNTHHPLLHTLLLKLCIDAVRLVGTLNRALALYSVLQSMLMAFLFAMTSASIARVSSFSGGCISTLFFALYPLHPVFASTSTKDVLFSGVFALLMALMVQTIAGKGRKRTYAGIILCGTLCCLLRNNMIYAAAVWTVLLLILLKRSGLRLAACMGLSLLLAAGMNDAMIASLDAQRGDMREMLSWPIQQLARARVHAPQRLNDEERLAIDRLIVKEKWQEYDPRISDPVKGAFNTEEFLRSPGAYLDVYASIGRKCPQEYLDAIAALIYPALYPYEAYRGRFDYIEVGIDTESFDNCFGEGRVSQNTRFQAVRDWLEENLWKTGGGGIPFVRWALNLGVIVWVMLFLVLKEVFMHRRDRFAVFLLPVLLWGTFLLGPTIYARYIYPFVCCLPVLATKCHSSE